MASRMLLDIWYCMALELDKWFGKELGLHLEYPVSCILEGDLEGNLESYIENLEITRKTIPYVFWIIKRTVERKYHQSQVMKWTSS